MNNNNQPKKERKKIISKMPPIVGAIANEPLARLTLNGKKQLVIEGACCILDYSLECIKISCARRLLQISGRQLCVKLMDKSGIVIEGDIVGFAFER